MVDEVSPDVVLLDLRLPDMDGMDVLRTLKGRYPEVAVIIITGFGQIQSAVEAMKAGASDYLEKPFEHLEKLKLAVSRALDEVRAKREIRRLWITRINAGARLNGLSYSVFMNGLKKAGVELDRKVLSDMAINDPEAFTALTEVAKKAVK